MTMQDVIAKMTETLGKDATETHLNTMIKLYRTKKTILAVGDYLFAHLHPTLTVDEKCVVSSAILYLDPAIVSVNL